MKKLFCGLMLTILISTLIGCDYGATKVKDGLGIPRPDVINVYNEGETLQLTQSDEDFDEVWSLIDNLFNKSFSYANIDSVTNESNIQEKKDAELCYEIKYSEPVKLSIRPRSFDGIFFRYGGRLATFTLYTLNEEGTYDYSETHPELGGSFYPIGYNHSVYKRKTDKIDSKIKELLE